MSVYVSKLDDCSSLKCYAVEIKDLTNEDKVYKKLFPSFKLKWPDFIEFDESNSIIITKHSQEGAYRIWNMADYKFKYRI